MQLRGAYRARSRGADIEAYASHLAEVILCDMGGTALLSRNPGIPFFAMEFHRSDKAIRYRQ